MATEIEPVVHAVTTFDRVNAILKGAVTTSKSAVVMIINSLTETLQGPDYFARSLERRTYTEIFHGGRTFYQLLAPPVWSTATLKVWDDDARVFTPGEELTLYEDYELDHPGPPSLQKPNIPGGIRHLHGAFGCGPANVKVVYEGGLINGPDAIPEDMAGDCAFQVAHWFQNADRVGLNQYMVPSAGSVIMRDPSKLLPGMQRLIHRYRIHRY